jgi:hypothetical protein
MVDFIVLLLEWKGVRKSLESGGGRRSPFDTFSYGHLDECYGGRAKNWKIAENTEKQRRIYGPRNTRRQASAAPGSRAELAARARDTMALDGRQGLARLPIRNGRKVSPHG